MTDDATSAVTRPEAPANPDAGQVRRIYVTPIPYDPWHKRLLNTLWSYEHLAVFYLLTGQLKDVITAYSLPVPIDISLASGALVVGFIGWAALSRREITFNGDQASRTICIFFLALIVMEILSVLWTQSTDWATTKSYKLLVIVPAFFAAQLWPGFSPVRFLKIFTVYGLVFVAWFVTMRYALWQNWDNDSGAFAIRNFYLGAGSVAAAIFLFHCSKPIFRPFLRTFVIIAAITLCAMTSARGPLLFAIMAIFICLMWHALTASRVNISPAAMLPAAISLGLAALAAIIFSDQIVDQVMYTFDRLDSLAKDSNPVRLKHYADSFQLISDRPWFGYGLGSYGVVITSVDVPHHPHNFFLEMWFESGIIGLILAVGLIGLLTVKLVINGDMLHRSICLFVVANMMKSGSIDDQKLNFGLIGLAMVIVATTVANRRYDESLPPIAPRSRPPVPERPGRGPGGLWLPHYDDVAFEHRKSSSVKPKVKKSDNRPGSPA